MKEHTKIKPQIIEKDGKPEFVIIPYDDYKHLTEAAENILEKEIYIPHEVVKAQVLHNITLMKAWREHLELTQTEVANRVGITQPAYQKIERISAEVRHTRPVTLRKIADAMGITVEQLSD